jgi:hypothetical protein
MPGEKAEPWWRDWIIAPLVALGLGFGMAIVFVPYFVWGAEHAAAFYGSLLAALVAAGAVVGNAHYQDLLRRKSETEKNTHERKARLMASFAYLGDIIVRLHVLKTTWEHQKWTTFPADVATRGARELIAQIAIPILKIPPPDYLDLATILRSRYADRVFAGLVPHQNMIVRFQAVVALIDLSGEQFVEFDKVLTDLENAVDTLRAARACISLELKEIDPTHYVRPQDQAALEKMEELQPMR